MKTVVVGVLLVCSMPFLAIGVLVSALKAEEAKAGPCTSASGTNAARVCAIPAAPASSMGPDRLVDDPTSSGRITERMVVVLDAAQEAFSGWPWSITCWDSHAWNPASDHPLGRACDFTVRAIGRRPTGPQVDQGWRLARWAEANARGLGISYIIWQGRIWSLARASEGWRAYNGGGAYNPQSITGGHYDHLHISVSG